MPEVEIQWAPGLASHQTDWKTIKRVANVEGKNTYRWTPIEGGQGGIQIGDPIDWDPAVVSSLITTVEESAVIVVDVPDGGIEVRTKWCCAHLKGYCECAATRGLAVFVESHHGREPHFLVQCRSVEIQDHERLNTPFPVSSIYVELHIN